MVDFIGVGAQKSGTSWIHACLFEHPEICSPVKEIHFFSRDRFLKGKGWYEEHFKKCPADKSCGEFSTSYLYDENTAKRITEFYPEVRIIAVLREPASRAYSQYRNAIKAGEIEESFSFDDYLEKEQSCINQGLYTKQLQRYFDVFSREQVLIMIYEDIAKNPQKFIKKVYEHIGVDGSFVPPSLERQINIARIPKNTKIDSCMREVAEFLRRHGASKLVHMIKSSGFTDLIRKVNTKENKKSVFDVTSYKKYFMEDVQKLSELINRDMMSEWDYSPTKNNGGETLKRSGSDGKGLSSVIFQITQKYNENNQTPN